METRVESKVLEAIGQRLIATELQFNDLNNSRVRIKYLQSDVAKKSGPKTVFGDCEKIPNKYKWAIPADFAITVYMPNCEHMSDEQLEMLIFHELLHIGVEFKANGNEEYRIIPHDLEDFKVVIEKYGTDWSIKPQEKK